MMDLSYKIKEQLMFWQRLGEKPAHEVSQLRVLTTIDGRRYLVCMYKDGDILKEGHNHFVWSFDYDTKVLTFFPTIEAKVAESRLITQEDYAEAGYYIAEHYCMHPSAHGNFLSLYKLGTIRDTYYMLVNEFFIQVDENYVLRHGSSSDFLVSKTMLEDAGQTKLIEYFEGGRAREFVV